MLLCSREKSGDAGTQEMMMFPLDNRMNNVGVSPGEGTTNPGQKPPWSV